jgi:hypothetical protein
MTCLLSSVGAEVQKAALQNTNVGGAGVSE